MELEGRYRVYNPLSTLMVIEGILEETLPGLRVPKKNESVPKFCKKSTFEIGDILLYFTS
jgi:hypothetical protein